MRVEGTGDDRFDGRRATAVPFLDGVLGQFEFDWFRHRREIRGLRMACAWINDTDRVATNTLVALDDGRARYRLIDFNSCLGAWNGCPKEPWRGHRYAIDLEELAVEALTLGLVHADYDPRQAVVSPAVGRFDARFDPMSWRGQFPNTAFNQMTEADLHWMAGKISGLSREHLVAIVAETHLTRAEDEAYLLETLLMRRAAILEAAGLDPAQAPPRGTVAAKSSDAQ